jgi:alkylhydroperoxidase family enzyme
MSGDRITLPEPAELRADVRDLLPLIAPAGRAPAETMQILARQPDLLAPFLGWAAALALEGHLPRRDHEILALRVAYNCASDYELAEHAAYARDAGLSDAEIARLATVDGSWSEADAALIRAADELDALSTLTDATFAELARRYDAGQLVEILYVIGQYTMLCLVANAAGLTAPNDARA